MVNHDRRGEPKKGGVVLSERTYEDRPNLWKRLLKQWIFLALLVFIAVFSVTAPGFLTVRNIRNIISYTSVPLLLALGQTFVIISGGIDLSVGAVLGFCGVSSALILKLVWDATGSVGFSIVAGTLSGMIIGTTLGAVSGTMIAKLKVPPFVVTLGMLGIARGCTYLLTSGRSIIGLPIELARIGNYRIWGVIPITLVVALLLIGISLYLLNMTRMGRYTYAIGGSETAAIRAGIPVARYKILIYALSGFMASCAGLVTLARFGTGSPLAGVNSELDSIAAVVIGGASLMGGIGTIFGSVVGALIIGVLLVGLVLLNVEPYWQMVSVGVILIIAVFLDQVRNKDRVQP